MSSIGIKFPIVRTQEGGVFDTTKTTEQAIRTNLIFLLTTKRGNRVMREHCYSPIYDIIMDPFDNITDELLQDAIREKVAEYLPQVSISRIVNTMEEDGKTLNINIIYSINSLGNIQGSVTLAFPAIED